MPRLLSVLLAACALAFSAPSMAADRPLFSIGAIADCQYAAEVDAAPRLYHTAPAKLAAAVADFNTQKLAFVVHLGDFIDRDWASFETVLPIARRLRAPLHFVLGNHDFAVDDAMKAKVPGKLGMPARYYSFIAHGWMFIVTDGNGLSSYGWPAGSTQLAHSLTIHASRYPDAPLWDGGIDEAQMRWIDERLAQADRRGLKAMLFSHFPAYPPNPHDLWNADAVIAMLERHASVKLWLDGHNHDGNYGLRDGIHYVNLKAMLDTPDTAYARLDVYRNRIELVGAGRQQSMTLPLK
jgi:hypothetical protein